MVGLPPLCTEADCNVKATAEIADSVNMIGIVTNAFSGNTARPRVAVAAVFWLHSQPFTGSRSQLFSLINRSSLLPYLPADTHCSLCSKLIACKVDLWNRKAPQMLSYLCGTLFFFFSTDVSRFHKKNDAYDAVFPYTPCLLECKPPFFWSALA